MNDMSTKPSDLYTLEGLHWLQEEVARKEAQWDNYSGNNPNKGAAARRALWSQIEAVTASLKSQGVLDYTPEELLKRSLDKQTPSRMKGCCTELEGQWFRIKFTGKDDRGSWQWTWEPVSHEQVQGPGSYVHADRAYHLRK